MLVALRAATRHLLHDFGFTVIAAGTLAAGIGTSTAAFAVLRGIVLRPLDYPRPEELVSLCDTHPSVRDFCVVTPPDAAEWASRSRTLRSVGIARDWSLQLRTTGGSTPVRGGLATPAVFATLGLPFVAGRPPAPDEQEPAPRRVAVLSERLWRTQFGASPDIVGTTVSIDGQPHQIIGVLAASARVPGLEEVELWIPLPFSQADEANRGWRGFRAIGRLAPGATIAGLSRELGSLQAEISARYPTSHQGSGVAVRDLRESVVGRARAAVWFFFGAVLAVTAIGCVNLANLVFARGLVREREFGIRLALGGSLPDLLRLLVAEYAVVALAGMSLGLLVTRALLDALIAAAPGGLPRIDDVRLDGFVLLAAALAATVIATLAGLVPASRAARVDPASLLAGAGRVAGPTSAGLRRALVTGQIAVATALTMGAALLARSVSRLLDWEPGFDRTELSVVWSAVSRERVTDGSRLTEIYDRALAAVRAAPGVRAASLVSTGPLFGGVETGEFLPGRGPGSDPSQRITAQWQDAGPGYFATLGVPLVAGRDLTETDRSGAPSVAIVNETLARRLWPDGDPIGRELIRGDDGARLTVVGVARDVPDPNPDRPLAPAVFWPFAQAPRWASYFVIRSGADPNALRAAIETAAPELDLYRVTGYPELERRILAGPRFNLSIAGAFAGLALVLALAGVYGVTSFTLAARQREIGIRLALGAAPGAIRAMLLREAAAIALIGAALGALGGLGIGRGIAAMLAGVRPDDPISLALVAATLVAGAVLASWLPARRGGRIDPASMLRSD